MNICHFLPWYSPRNIGGTEIYILTLVKSIQSEHHKNFIICPSIGATEEIFYIENIKIIATPSIKLKQDFQIEVGLKCMNNLQQFEDILVRENVNIIHFHCFWRKQFSYLMIAKNIGIKTIITPHLSTFTCLQGSLLFGGKEICDGKVTLEKCTRCLIKTKTKQSILEYILYKSSILINKVGIRTNFDRKYISIFGTAQNVQGMLNTISNININVNLIISISKWYHAVLAINGIAKDKLICIPTTIRKRTRRTIALDKNLDKIKIGFIGRLNHEKGLHLLLAAFEQLDINKYELHLFGKEQDIKISNQIISIKNKGYNINNHGEVSNTELHDFYLKNIDLICFPSVSMEMAPLVILESLAYGIPVIGPNRGGASDIIVDGFNGLTFKHNDKIDLLKKIKYITKDYSTLQSFKNNCLKENKQKDFTMEHVGIYNKIIA